MLDSAYSAHEMRGHYLMGSGTSKCAWSYTVTPIKEGDVFRHNCVFVLTGKINSKTQVVEKDFFFENGEKIHWIWPNRTLLILYIWTAGWRNIFKGDHRSWGRNLCTCEKKSWKIQACRYANPDLFDYQCSKQANWELQGSFSQKARKRSGPKANLKSKPVEW